MAWRVCRRFSCVLPPQRRSQYDPPLFPVLTVIQSAAKETAAAASAAAEVSKTSTPPQEAAGATAEVDGDPGAEVAAERIKRALEIRGRLKDSRLPVLGAEVRYWCT